MEDYKVWIKLLIMRSRKQNPSISKKELKDKTLDALAKEYPWSNGELDQWDQYISELLDNYY